jgi:hypothetical protein
MHLLEFTYTYEDYAEANSAHMAIATGRARGRPQVLAWVVFIALVVMFFLLLNRRGPVSVGRPAVRLPGAGATTAPVARRTPVVPTLPARSILMFLPLLPPLAIFAVIAIFVTRQLRRGRAVPQSVLLPAGGGRPDPSRPSWASYTRRRALAWSFALGAIVLALVLVLLDNGAPPDRGAADSSLGLVLKMAPWFLVVAALLAIARSGLGVRRLWEGQAHLQRPKRLEVSDDGVVLSDAVSRSEQRWPAFSHAVETPNLFLLYLSNFSFQMVPKRGFASAAEADEFREIVRRMILERPGPAFPVLPAATLPEPQAADMTAPTGPVQTGPPRPM